MTVLALDHINLVTEDLDGTCAFYTQLLGLERRDAPSELPPDGVQWLHDSDGRPLFHVTTSAYRKYSRPPGPDSAPTGAIDHIALNCTGHDAMLARLETMGLPYRQSGLPSIGLRQIFVSDPNCLLLELNFRG